MHECDYSEPWYCDTCGEHIGWYCPICRQVYVEEWRETGCAWGECEVVVMPPNGDGQGQ